MAACSQGHIGAVQHLLGWRANVNISDVVSDSVMFTYACIVHFFYLFFEHGLSSIESIQCAHESSGERSHSNSELAVATGREGQRDQHGE